MFEKLQKVVDKDDLFWHKVGLAVGTFVGFLVGLVVSDQADQFIVEEVVDEGAE